MTDLERVDEVVQYLIFHKFGKNEKEIAIALDYSSNYFSQIKNNHQKLSDKFLKKLCSLDENINFDWVKFGTGEMLTSKVENEEPIVKENEVEYENIVHHNKLTDLRRSLLIIESQQSTIHELATMLKVYTQIIETKVLNNPC